MRTGRGEFSGHSTIQIQRMDSMRSLLAIGALALGVMSPVIPAQAAGVHMIVRHEVTDYATWRKSYDTFGATQKDMGVGL
jgi:hypothetical protein